VSPDARPAFGSFVGWGATTVIERSLFAVEKSAEVVVPAGIVGGWEGPNVRPSIRRSGLVIVASTAANPVRGLVGGVIG